MPSKIEKLEGYLRSTPYKMDQDHLNEAIEEIRRLEARLTNPEMVEVQRNAVESAMRILNMVAQGDHRINSIAVSKEAGSLARTFNLAIDTVKTV